MIWLNFLWVTVNYSFFHTLWEILSHTFFAKISWKQRNYYIIINGSWFDELFFSERISCFTISWNQFTGRREIRLQWYYKICSWFDEILATKVLRALSNKIAYKNQFSLDKQDKQIHTYLCLWCHSNLGNSCTIKRYAFSPLI